MWLSGQQPLKFGLAGVATTTGNNEWRLESGVLVPSPSDDMSFVVFREPARDVEIQLEIFPQPGANSGVFVRCADPENITPVTCYELNVWDAHPNRAARTGAVVGFAPPIADVPTAGRWSKLRVHIEGARLRFWIDATLVNDIAVERLAAGNIALQYGGGELVRFRNIRVRYL